MAFLDHYYRYGYHSDAVPRGEDNEGKKKSKKNVQTKHKKQIIGFMLQLKLNIDIQ